MIELKEQLERGDCMIGSQMTSEAVFVLNGLLVLLAVAGSIYGGYVIVRKIRTDNAERQQRKIDIAVLESKKETASEMAFKDLKDSVDNMNKTLICYTESTARDIQNIKAEDLERVKWLVRIEESTKSAHKRLDEHRAVEHGFPNGQHHRVDDIMPPEERKEQ